ncbi:MAG: c-type cytochrome [Pseudomonadota bacterium]|nr:c-type cytochrome [Pseudomonadota bacterium]
MFYKTCSAILASGLLLTPPTILAEDLSTFMLVAPCAACHGPEGSSVGPATPTISGFSTDSFLEAMEMFKSGDRPSTIMERLAKGYSKQDFEVMAKYFAQQEFVRYEQQTDAAKAKKGAELHDEYCEKCHEENGFVDEDGSAVLAGQWLPYLQFSLEDYHQGEREMTKKMRKRMKKMVEEHGEESLDQVAHFYASQTQKP